MVLLLLRLLLRGALLLPRARLVTLPAVVLLPAVLLLLRLLLRGALLLPLARLVTLLLLPPPRARLVMLPVAVLLLRLLLRGALLISARTKI